MQTVGSMLYRKKSIVLYRYSVGDNIVDEIRDRLRFYLPSMAERITEVCKPFSFHFLTTNPLLITGNVSTMAKFLIKRRKGTFYVDHIYNYRDGWEWCQLAMIHGHSKADINAAQRELINYINKLRSQDYKRVYLFGTGPSLSMAMNHSWDDGYRVVCNTIVRDKELWHHINPHFVVAGDPIYHFGFTSFARSFRDDLRKRLSETDTKFMYPLIFHEIVSREFLGAEGQLIPVPYGSHQRIHNDLSMNFSLPALGNVLNLLLLPLGCTLAKDVYLWGFDGRAPMDKLFWSNSLKHSYPEHMDELRKAHPAFFSYYVPEENPEKYVQAVHGDSLEHNLLDAEALGWHFNMLHDSYTPTLQKRRVANRQSPLEP